MDLFSKTSIQMSARIRILTKKLIEAKQKKQRDTRTHDGRVKDLRKAFEYLKLRAEASGHIYECSVSKVAKRANVNDVYLYKDKLKDPSVNKKYHDVRDSIILFIIKFKENRDKILEESALGEAIKDRNDFEAERNAAHLATAKIQQKNLQLENDLDYYKNRQKETEDNSIAIAHARLASKVKSSTVLSFTKVKIVCPDDHLIDNGSYDDSNQTKIDNALTVAKSELSYNIKNTHIPMRIYMLIGVQNAGKTQWRDDRKNFYNDRQPIVIDSINLTKAARADWFLELSDIREETITEKKDIKVCAVYFDVPLLQLQHRNSMRPPEKRIDIETLADNFAKLQAPTTAERFDEIIIVRQK
jgi:hypothetical protein